MIEKLVMIQMEIALQKIGSHVWEHPQYTNHMIYLTVLRNVAVHSLVPNRESKMNGNDAHDHVQEPCEGLYKVAEQITEEDDPLRNENKECTDVDFIDQRFSERFSPHICFKTGGLGLT